ncbi:MAG TPA: spondin domain-containing protein [Candidatus Methylomirabilis sp.]|nr:spondin domain-containing protein [Candidatus Methylomirabilis sp.]
MKKTHGIRLLAGAALLALGPMVSAGHAAAPAQQFRVRIENVSTENTLRPSTGAKAPAAVAPVLYVIHTNSAPLFTSGKSDRGKGLEQLAEEGNPAPLAESLRNGAGIMAAGVTDTPVGAAGPGPIGPGGTYEFSFSATPGSRLSIAMMFGQSNDLFYAPGEAGIALYDSAGKPVSGDITSQIILWDAGTEVNEEPGAGPNQAPRQPAPNTGPRENGVVRPIAQVNDGFKYPGVSEVIRVTINPMQQLAR